MQTVIHQVLRAGAVGAGAGFAFGLPVSNPESDDSSAHGFGLAEAWRGLASGKLRARESFLSEDRCFLLLSRRLSLVSAPSLQPRNLEILERLLRGERQKVVAYDLALAVSTVACAAKEALTSMGFAESASRVPLLLVLAAEAARGELWVESTRVTHFTQGPEHYQLVSCARPDAELSRALAPAACAVTRMLVEGKSHAEIAAARNTSIRTVANQLAAAFSRLRVSGRAELLYRLATGGTFTAGAPAARAERHAS